MAAHTLLAVMDELPERRVIERPVCKLPNWMSPGDRGSIAVSSNQRVTRVRALASLAGADRTTASDLAGSVMPAAESST